MADNESTYMIDSPETLGDALCDLVNQVLEDMGADYGFVIAVLQDGGGRMVTGGLTANADETLHEDHARCVEACEEALDLTSDDPHTQSVIGRGKPDTMH